MGKVKTTTISSSGSVRKTRKRKKNSRFERIIINSHGCKVYVISNYLSSRLLNDLKVEIKNLEFQSLSFKMYGKTFTPKRKTLSFSDTGISYRYSGTNQASSSWTLHLQELKDKINSEFKSMLNFALVQSYPDGKAKIGWHSDDESDLVEGSMIGSFSIGSTRKFKLRYKDSKKRKKGNVINVDLAENDLLLMKGKTQKVYQHCIPKQERVKNHRWNITFRNIERMC